MKRLQLKAERVRRGISCEEMAKKLDISTSTYYRYEDGTVDIPVSKAALIANIFNEKMDFLFNNS